MTLGGGVSEILRITFLETVFGLKVSFFSLYIFLGYEFDVMAVLGGNLCFAIVGKKRNCMLHLL